MHLLVSELGHRNIFKMPPLTGNFTMCTFRLIQLAWGKVDDVKLCLIVETDRLARLGTALHNDVAANHNTSTIAITDSNTSHEMKDSLGFQDQPERERYVLAAWEWLRNILSKKKKTFYTLVLPINGLMGSTEWNGNVAQTQAIRSQLCIIQLWTSRDLSKYDTTRDWRQSVTFLIEKYHERTPSLCDSFFVFGGKE